MSVTLPKAGPAGHKEDKPVHSTVRAEEKNWYSVEEVNWDRDHYRWWALFLTKDLRQAYAALAEYKAMHPNTMYRLILQVVLETDEDESSR